MLNRDSPVALYLQLADDIARMLRTRLRPGERLPSEAALVQQYGVSRITVRQALAHLERQGLIERKQGKGTFAAAPRIRQDLHHLTGFYAFLQQQGLEPETHLVRFEIVAAPPPVQQALRLPTPQALFYQRQYLLNGAPFAVTCVHLPLSVAANITREIAEQHPTYTLLERFIGREIGYANLSIRARPAPRPVAKLLGERATRSVLTLERVTFCPRGEPLEHTLLYLRPDSYEFSLTALRGGVSLSQGIKPVRDGALVGEQR